MNKPSYMDLAIKFAQYSKDTKIKVGCLITNTIDSYTYEIALSYNGNPYSLSQKRDSLESGKSGYLHAEMRAALKAARDQESGLKTVYVTLPPCSICSKLLLELSNFKELHYIDHPDYSKDGIKLLESVGIKIVKYEK